MAFKLAKTETFKAQVEISTPDEKGRIEKETVTCTFKRKSEDELDALSGKSNVEVLKEVLSDVAGMVDDDRQPVPWNEATMNAFLQIPQATFAAAAKFWTLSRIGREKN
jgi:hypothetical protein